MAERLDEHGDPLPPWGYLGTDSDYEMDLPTFVKQVRKDFRQDRKRLMRIAQDLLPEEKVLDLQLNGSYARGSPRPDSDIDVLISVRGPLDSEEIIDRLMGELNGIGGSYDIQVDRYFGGMGGTARRPAELIHE
jgi:predicted nucleotidyltransferase